MKSQNKITNQNSYGNLNHGMDTPDQSIHSNSQVSEKFRDINDLKGFNDYAIEGFIDYSIGVREKK